MNILWATRHFRYNFAMRNRIVSGLATAVIVIEGAEKSGTLLYCRTCRRTGKNGFCSSGTNYFTTIGGTNYLLQNGAKIAVTALKTFWRNWIYRFKVDTEEVEKVMPEVRMRLNY